MSYVMICDTMTGEQSTDTTDISWRDASPVELLDVVFHGELDEPTLTRDYPLLSDTTSPNGGARTLVWHSTVYTPHTIVAVFAG